MSQVLYNSSKIINTADFAELRNIFREKGQKVIHCHGVFDLLHPGHIAHLEEAKNLGDILVVSVTSAPYVNKGPGRPYFSDDSRMKTLAALCCVDYVLLSETPTVIELLEFVQPDLYVKGEEYEKTENDVTQNINREIDKVRSCGGDVYFTGGITFSSTSLLNNNFPVFPPEVKEYAKNLANRFTFTEIKKIIDDFSKLKILVIGDIVIDEYVFCSVQGLMSKDRAFSAKYQKEERYMGGSLAVARHLSSFVNNVTICSFAGNEPDIHHQIFNNLSAEMSLDIQFDPYFQTPIKRRYIEKRGIRNEYEKLFSINYIMEGYGDKKIDRSTFYQKLNNNISNYDLVVVTDYGHGLIDQKIMDIIQEKACFLAVNCQTNSSNFGTNLITKYRRADTFTLDQKELSLAFSTNSQDYQTLLTKLSKQLNSEMGWLTMGSLGALATNKNESIHKAPALTLTVQDTVGAGDAFYALACLSAKASLPMEIGTFLGNIAGALAANILGNSEAVSKVDFLKFATTMLKF